MCATTRHNGETQTQDHKYGQNEISILGTPSWLWDNIASKPSILILSLITSTASIFLPPNNIHSILVRAWMLATCQLAYHRVLIYVSLKIHRNSLGVMWCGVAVDFVTQDKTRQESRGTVYKPMSARQERKTVIPKYQISFKPIKTC